MINNLRNLLENCIECNLCVKDCDFLTTYGNPKDIDKQLNHFLDPQIPYSCSLCSACESACPAEVPIKDYFLARRQEIVTSGSGPLPAHRGLIFYERLVSSSLFTAYFLPAGSKKVLFPGCGAIGKAPQTIRKLYTSLQQETSEPLGLVLDCCLKISHDLGRQRFFAKAFGKLQERLKNAGITEVITLCPSCTEVFRQHSDFLVTPAYHLLATSPKQKPAADGRYSVHDACILRRDHKTQNAVREIVNRCGASLTPLPLEGKKTVCCGEGGAAWCIDKTLAVRYRKRRLQGLTATMVVYCYACRDFLDPENRLGILHILELLFGREKRYPNWRTWLNRRGLRNFVRKLTLGNYRI